MKITNKNITSIFTSTDYTVELENGNIAEITYTVNNNDLDGYSSNININNLEELTTLDIENIDANLIKVINNQ